MTFNVARPYHIHRWVRTRKFLCRACVVLHRSRRSQHLPRSSRNLLFHLQGHIMSHGRLKCASLPPSTTRRTRTDMSGSSTIRMKNFAMAFKFALVRRRIRMVSIALQTIPRYTSVASAASPAMAETGVGSSRRAAKVTAGARQMEVRDRAKVANLKQKRTLGRSGASGPGEMPSRRISIKPLRHLGRPVARMTLVTIGFQCYPA